MSKKPFSAEERENLARLAAMPKDRIDTGDIPEALEENWRLARRGELYRPLKKPVTIRLDADILAWFKDHAKGRGYQGEINRVLRRYVLEVEKKRA